MSNDPEDGETTGDGSGIVESDSDARENSDRASNPDNSVTTEEGSAPQDQWFERLENYQQKLESTTDPERRRELIEIIKDVEDGLVEEGMLEESERGDYSVQPTSSQEDTDQTDEAGTGRPQVSSGAENSESTASPDQRGSEPGSQSQTRTRQQDPGDGDRDTESVQGVGDREETADSGSVEEKPSEVETAEGSSGVGNHSTNDEGPADRDPSTATETNPESSDQTEEQSETNSLDVDDRTSGESGDANDGSGDEERTEPGTKAENTTDTEGATGNVTGNPYIDSASADTEETDTLSDGDESGEVEDQDEEDTDSPPETDSAQPQDVEALATRVEELEDLFEEFKRSNEHEHQEIRKYSVETFAKNMLHVRDTLERAVELFDWDAEKRTRMEAVISQFDQQYTAGEISAIEPQPGSEFDYNRHEVVEREQTADYEEDEIIRIERKGFELGDHVIRPAQVVIAA